VMEGERGRCGSFHNSYYTTLHSLRRGARADSLCRCINSGGRVLRYHKLCIKRTILTFTCCRPLRVLSRISHSRTVL
jgi:hypothetical protein